MLNGLIATAAAAVIGVAGIGALGFSSTAAPRTDCPGKIVCPINGEEVCRDQCPAIDLQRDDCPGRIECPINGELVCEDRCPLGEGEEAPTEAALPACCRK